MLRILQPLSAMLVAFSASPQEAFMRSFGPAGTTVEGTSETRSQDPDAAAPNLPGQGADDRRHAARGPVPGSVSAEENPAPAPAGDTVAEAGGRRILSTAFVMLGPEGHLTVELRDGRVMVLRDVVMRPRDYCGLRTSDSAPGTRYCGRYADVVAARPGGPPTRDEPIPAGADPATSEHRPVKRP